MPAAPSPDAKPPQAPAPAGRPAAGATQGKPAAAQGKPAAARPPGGAPGAPASNDDLRGKNYADGKRAVQPAALPGLPQSPGEAMGMAQQSVRSANVGATMTEGTTAYKDSDIQVDFDPGSRLAARLDGGGIHLTAEPGILIQVRNAPDFRLKSITWSFAEGRFITDAAAAHFDVLGVLGRLGSWKIAKVLDQKLKPLLPAAVQRAGYSPRTDLDLAGTISQMTRMFDFAQAPGAGAGGAGGMAGKLRDASAGLNVDLPKEFRVPLGDSGMELVIDQGTPLSLSAQSQGALAHPVIQSLSLGAGGKGIRVKPVSGNFKEFKELDMRSVNIARGGTFTFDYDLSAERLADGLVGLVQLLGMATGHPVGGQAPDIKLDFVRKEIDAKLQEEVPGRFRALLEQYDQLVPGMSLKGLFGAG